MTLGEFRELTKDLDDHTVMFIANTAHEWYGIATMCADAWDHVNADLIFYFSNESKEDARFDSERMKRLGGLTEVE